MAAKKIALGVAGGAALTSCSVPSAPPPEIPVPTEGNVPSTLSLSPETMAERDTVRLIRGDGSGMRITIDRSGDAANDVIHTKRKRPAPSTASTARVEVTVLRAAQPAEEELAQRLVETRARELQRVVPGLSRARARQLAPHLEAAMAGAGMTSRTERAAFVAQLAHESLGFSRFEEIASGAAYEGRLDLGNTEPGDGRRYKGRGPIQLTGRANYRAAGEALGLDLEGHPELASRIDVGFRVAAWYWESNGISEPAREGDFARVTELINGGMTHYDQRVILYERALRAIS